MYPVMLNLSPKHRKEVNYIGQASTLCSRLPVSNDHTINHSFNYSLVYSIFLFKSFFCGSKPDPLDRRSRLSVGMVGVALETYGLDLGDIGRFEQQFVVFKDVPSVFSPFSQAVTPRANNDVAHISESLWSSGCAHFFCCVPDITDRLRRGERPPSFVKEDK